MTKYTKHQYLADIATNEAAIIAIQDELNGYNIRVEAGEKITEELSDAWNAAYDKEWELQQGRHDIEIRWTQRNWTGADYASYELVSANID